MKKLTIITAILFTLLATTSCLKDDGIVDDPNNEINNNNSNEDVCNTVTKSDLYGIWVSDKDFRSSLNQSYEFRRYNNKLVSREFIGNTDVEFSGTNDDSYSISSSGDQITMIVHGKQAVMDVVSYTTDKMVIRDYEGVEYTYYRSDVSSYKYAKFVDLGLPSGTLWANHNLGGFTSDEEGCRYAWGGIEEGVSGNDIYIGENISQTQYDAAYRENKGWCMPTQVNYKELFDNCSISSDTHGYKITGPNNNSIFVYSDGYYADNFYWTSSYYGKPYSYHYAYCADFYHKKWSEYDFIKDCNFIRPVANQSKAE